jgi:hypothetical protein
MSALELRCLGLALIKPTRDFTVSVGIMRTPFMRVDFGFGGNGIVHHIPFWLERRANAKRTRSKTVPLVSRAKAQFLYYLNAGARWFIAE